MTCAEMQKSGSFQGRTLFFKAFFDARAGFRVIGSHGRV